MEKTIEPLNKIDKREFLEVIANIYNNPARGFAGLQKWAREEYNGLHKDYLEKVMNYLDNKNYYPSTSIWVFSKDTIEEIIASVD